MCTILCSIWPSFVSLLWKLTSDGCGHYITLERWSHCKGTIITRQDIIYTWLILFGYSTLHIKYRTAWFCQPKWNLCWQNHWFDIILILFFCVKLCTNITLFLKLYKSISRKCINGTWYIFRFKECNIPVSNDELSCTSFSVVLLVLIKALVCFVAFRRMLYRTTEIKEVI